jgi:hypothetical protein
MLATSSIPRYRAGFCNSSAKLHQYLDLYRYAALFTLDEYSDSKILFNLRRKLWMWREERRGRDLLV